MQRSSEFVTPPSRGLASSSAIHASTENSLADSSKANSGKLSSNDKPGGFPALCFRVRSGRVAAQVVALAVAAVAGTASIPLFVQRDNKSASSPPAAEQMEIGLPSAAWPATNLPIDELAEAPPPQDFPARDTPPREVSIRPSFAACFFLR